MNLFNWQEEAAGMISQMEFVRRVNVQADIIEEYIQEGKLVAGLTVPLSNHRVSGTLPKKICCSLPLSTNGLL